MSYHSEKEHLIERIAQEFRYGDEAAAVGLLKEFEALVWNEAVLESISQAENAYVGQRR